MSTISLFSGTVPALNQSQPTFDTNTQAFIDYIANLAPEINTFAALLNALATTDTSVTSNTIGTGSKTFTVSAGKSFFIGMSLTIANTVAPTNRMFAVVSSYSGTTLQVTSQAFEGTGTFSAWSISASFNGIISTGQLADLGTTNAKLAFDGGSLGYRNAIINGGMAIDQRNVAAAQTITAAAALAYTVDRWYAYCTGANVTGQRVAGASLSQYRYRFTGAASVTKIGFAQRIETANSYHFNNGTATLSVDLANSLLTTVTWVAYYANTADTFGTLASPTRTQIATGTFTVNSTVSRYSTNISIPSSAITGIEIEFSVAAQTSGTWTIGDVQFEKGATATSFEYRSYGIERLLSQRYYEKSYADNTALATNTNVGTKFAYSNIAGDLDISVQFQVVKRVAPTVRTWDANSNATSVITFTGAGAATTRTPTISRQCEKSALVSATTSDVAIQFHYDASAEL